MKSLLLICRNFGVYCNHNNNRKVLHRLIHNKLRFSSSAEPATKINSVRLQAEAGDASSQCLLAWYYGNGTSEGSQITKDTEAAFHWYSKAAEGGNATAQNNLGVLYRTGEVPSVPSDPHKAFFWFQKSAMQQHPSGLFNAASMLINGEGVDKNLDLGRQYLLRAVELGDADAQYTLALKYQEKEQDFVIVDNGQPAHPDVDKEIFRLYHASAQQGRTVAQVNLAYCYIVGLGTAVDETKAVEWYSEAASIGNSVSAKCHLGWCYWTGKGVAADKMKAKELFEHSAEKGHVPAMYNLAMWFKQEAACCNDPDLKKSYKSSFIQFLTMAASEDEVRAQALLGWCYRAGDCVDVNFFEAVKWFQKAAELGDARSQFNLAWCFQHGQGVAAKDFHEAVRWLRRAALQNHAVAQYNLGYCYIAGTGVKQDNNMAVIWYRKAAENGSAKAQYYLGVCYRNGIGVGRDLIVAQQWFEKAAQNGSEEAIAALTKLRV